MPSPMSVIHLVPQYFPGLETMALIARSERCLLTDTKQYSRQSFENRTRVRNPDGSQWLSIPLQKGEFGRTLLEVYPEKNRGWKTRHLKAFKYNYSTSPFYENYYAALSLLLHGQHDNLADLTCATVLWCAETLGLKMEIGRKSEMSDALRGEDQLPPSNYVHPTYRQNFDGFRTGMSVLDLIFNHGPDSRQILSSGWPCD